MFLRGDLWSDPQDLSVMDTTKAVAQQEVRKS